MIITVTGKTNTGRSTAASKLLSNEDRPLVITNNHAWMDVVKQAFNSTDERMNIFRKTAVLGVSNGESAFNFLKTILNTEQTFTVLIVDEITAYTTAPQIRYLLKEYSDVNPEVKIILVEHELAKL